MAPDPLADIPVPPRPLGIYRGYALRRNGTVIIAVHVEKGYRLVGDFDNTIEAKNAVDAALAPTPDEVAEAVGRRVLADDL